MANKKNTNIILLLCISGLTVTLLLLFSFEVTAKIMTFKAKLKKILGQSEIFSLIFFVSYSKYLSPIPICYVFLLKKYVYDENIYMKIYFNENIKHTDSKILKWDRHNSIPLGRQ